MKFDSRKINFKLWMYFTLFSGLIMILLWLLQIVFIGYFYDTMKKNDIIKIADNIISKYGQNDFQTIIDQIAFKNSILIYVTDTSGNILYSSDEHGYGQPSGQRERDNISQKLTDIYRPLPEDYADFINNLNNSAEEYITYVIEQNQFDGKTLIYGAKLQDAYLYISTPLEPLNSTTTVLSTQLIYITIISLILSFIIAFFIARKLSKPISNITDSAKELAIGNYNIKFEDGYYSEIDELATTLNYTANELSKVENLRRELIANISHDLRTPLTMIKAYSEMIQDISGEDKEKREEHLKIIVSETDRLTNLVNNILDLSLLQSGNEEVKFDNINLSETVKKVLERFKPLCEKNGYSVDKNIENDLYVLGDVIRLEQVLYNLIGNAINYIGEDKLIEVKLIDLGSKVRFEVKDNGVGIAKEDINHIWDRYYTAKTHKREETEGTGIGLSIVKSILEMHKAEYGVESELGNGSTFWFEINK